MADNEFLPLSVNDLNDGFLFNVFEEITSSPVLPGVGNTSNPGSPTDNGRNSLSAMNGSTSVRVSWNLRRISLQLK
jgi:hypothetical protein